MIFQSFKTLLLTLNIFIGLNSTAIAQDFYKDYKTYLTGKQSHTNNIKRTKLIDAHIERVKSTIQACEKENGRSFFTTDTVFMIDFLGAESGNVSEIMWTHKASCYYDFYWDLDKAEGEKPTRKLTINTHPTEIIASFDSEFRKAIELGDTVAYLKYADKHKVFDGQFVSPLLAVRNGGHWKFTPFKGNGWAIDYDNVFKKTDKKAEEPANLNAIINKLSKERLGFDIDSANAFYLNDTSKFKKQPSYPVILLNGKVINYWQHEPVEIARIKAIAIWEKNSHDLSIPVGITNEFGIIMITTRENTN